MAIDEIDVWHTGTEEELSKLIGSAIDSPLEGHPDLVCVSACREDEHPVATDKTTERLDEDGRPVINIMTNKPHVDAVTRPGRSRVRLSYKPEKALP